MPILLVPEEIFINTRNKYQCCDHQILTETLSDTDAENKRGDSVFIGFHSARLQILDF